MAAANRNLEEEFDTLKAGLDTLRKDISSLVSSFGDAATDEAKTRGRRARAGVGRATDRAGEVWDDATNEASRRGLEGVAAGKQQIGDRPVISLVGGLGRGLAGRVPVPDSERSVVRAPDRAPPVRRHRHRIDRLAMALQGGQQRTLLQ